MRMMLWTSALVASQAMACDGEGGASGGLDCPSGATTYRLGGETWCRRADGVANGPYERVNDDGTSLQGAYAGGLPDGAWTIRDADGEVTSEHFWAFGQPCGTWRELSNGEVVTTIELDDCDGVDEPEPTIGPPLAVVGDFGWDGVACAGGLTLVDVEGDPGARACVDGDGVRAGDFGRWQGEHKLQGGQYEGGVASGTWRTWYEDGGSVSTEGAYDGGRTGLWRTWRPDRTLESECGFVDDVRDGACTTYWPGGNKQAQGAYAAGAADGAWQSWYPTAIGDEVVTWKAGVREGVYTKNHDSGLHAVAGSYLADQRTGTWTTWHDNGVLATEGNYQAGLATGRWKTFERDGLPATDGPYVEGLQHGTFTVWAWQLGERVKWTGEVALGLQHGLWSAVHDPGGEPAADVGYGQTGLREGPSTTTWKSGHRASEGDYHAGLPAGPWRFYYPSGQLFIDASFDAGRYEGDYREYWDNGELKAQGAYHDGVKQPGWQYFDADGRPTTDPGDA